jgi:nitric oxide reductase subunit C
MKFTLFVIALLAALALAACSGGPATEPTPTPDPLVIQGRQVFNARCATCHALEPDTIIIGPSLAEIASRAETRVPGLDARAYIEESVLVPGAYVVEGFNDVMTKNFAKDVTSEEFDALIAFLMTLR